MKRIIPMHKNNKKMFNILIKLKREQVIKLKLIAIQIQSLILQIKKIKLLMMHQI